MVKELLTGTLKLEQLYQILKSFMKMSRCFYHFKYPYADGNGYIEIATTRPETMLGDTAIVVNPNDERYKDVIGKTVILPIVGRVTYFS